MRQADRGDLLIPVIGQPRPQPVSGGCDVPEDQAIDGPALPRGSSRRSEPLHRTTMRSLGPSRPVQRPVGPGARSGRASPRCPAGRHRAGGSTTKQGHGSGIDRQAEHLRAGRRRPGQRPTAGRAAGSSRPSAATTAPRRPRAPRRSAPAGRPASPRCPGRRTRGRARRTVRGRGRPARARSPPGSPARSAARRDARPRRRRPSIGTPGASAAGRAQAAEVLQPQDHAIGEPRGIEGPFVGEQGDDRRLVAGRRRADEPSARRRQQQDGRPGRDAGTAARNRLLSVRSGAGQGRGRPARPPRQLGDQDGHRAHEPAGRQGAGTRRQDRSSRTHAAATTAGTTSHGPTPGPRTPARPSPANRRAASPSGPGDGRPTGGRRRRLPASRTPRTAG